MELTAGRYLPEPARDRAVRNPARDTLSGGLVTVLRAPAPADPHARARELARLRRLAATRSPSLAEVRAVELHGEELRVVCEPLTGHRPDEGPALAVTAVQSVAAGLLDALAALHAAGIVHGAVRPDAVLLSTGPGGTTGTLLPLPLTPDDTPALATGHADDDTRATAALLLALLARAPLTGMEDEVLAIGLHRVLERAGGSAGEPWGPPGSGLVAPTGPVHRSRPPVPLGVHPHSLAPRAVDPPPAPPVVRPAPRPSRRRAALVVAGTAVAAIAALVAVLTLTGDTGGRPRAVPAAAPPAATPSPTPSPTPTPTPTPAADLPTTVPALVDALAADPAAAGPSGPVLLDALRGLASGEGGIAQQSALRLVQLVLDDPGLDPRWAAAGLVALDTGPVPGPPGAPPSCFGVVPGAPDPVAQQFAQRVLDRLAAWQAQGLPADRAARIAGLATPVAAGQAVPVLAPC